MFHSWNGEGGVGAGTDGSREWVQGFAAHVAQHSKGVCEVKDEGNGVDGVGVAETALMAHTAEKEKGGARACES